MEFVYLFVAFFSGFFTMAVAEKNGWNKVFGFLAGPVIIVLIISLFSGASGGSSQSVSEQPKTQNTQQEIVKKELTPEQKGDTKLIKTFSDQVLKIEEEWFKVWYEIQEQTKTGSPSVVQNALERGFISMQDFKERVDRIIIPDLSDNSAKSKIKSARSDYSNAYYSGQLYFAFAQRMIASNDIKEIDSSWAGAEEMKKDMFDYKAKASLNLSEVLSQYGI